ncbi:hypothetical protein AYI70_g5743 [Smittium culicis]|uniref:Uncharacterized protein n=1 Tax=Smittium culicis TaxID=133412 RepID=A0A1R1XT00_9FUNG|nr:hypothetical protein AYI70_g5743 [Smittium culicis]
MLGFDSISNPFSFAKCNKHIKQNETEMSLRRSAGYIDLSPLTTWLNDCSFSSLLTSIIPGESTTSSPSTPSDLFSISISESAADLVLVDSLVFGFEDNFFQILSLSFLTSTFFDTFAYDKYKGLMTFNLGRLKASLCCC